MSAVRLSREEAKLLTRHRLIQAGQQIMLEQGYEGLTTGRIASRAGLRQPSFYVHFSDKDELLEEMANTIVSKLRTALRETRRPLKQGGELEPATRETFRLSLASIRKHADMLRLFLAERHRSKSSLGACASRLMDELVDDLCDDLCGIALLGQVPRRRLWLLAEMITNMTAHFGLVLASRSDEDPEVIADMLTQTTITLLLNAANAGVPEQALAHGTGS